jgi:hypothetical protein
MENEGTFEDQNFHVVLSLNSNSNKGQSPKKELEW